MSSDSDPISHLTPLDELIQVIYQGSSRFVIISAVDDASWSVHVGLTGDDGRWWQGRWTEKDVRNVVGTKVSGFLLDSFVEKLADTFVKGEMSIGGWSSGKAAPIQLDFGTHAKTPIHVDLHELPLRDAAAYATKTFAEIALQAQRQKCRLYPSLIDVPGVTGAVPAASTSLQSHRRWLPEADSTVGTYSQPPHKVKGKDNVSDAVPASDNKFKRKAEEAEEEIQVLRAELEKSKRQQNAIMTDPSKLYSKNKPVPTSVKPKGVSMANPTKKARKYKPLEFESDDE
ncbi:hypothetical protein BC628DRAFT_1384137 [Trametes gibbosa]|nr:hypothetical protein BC628DRAFT_1384137 [Trametes gibbosa]